MKSYRVFFNESIVSTLEAENEEEARQRFAEEEMKEMDAQGDIDVWFDFEEVPARPRMMHHQNSPSS